MAFQLFQLLLLLFANVAFSLAHGNQNAPTPKVSYFGTMHLTFGDFLIVGNTPMGSPIITETQAGNITGPNFEGQLALPAGDWAWVDSTNHVHIDGRYQFKLTDGSIIYVQATGVSPATGSETDLPTKMYLRPIFETGAEKYFYMNYMVSTALVRRNGLDLTLDIWEVTWPNV
ncbi:hypothetical protein V8C42DRAFT_343832 [Trichoderma barbatum]